MLHFYVTKGEKINEYYHSAHLLLTEESKNFLRNLGEFSGLDNHFQLNTDDFYIWANIYAYRDELYYKTANRTYSYPIDWVRFSVDMSHENLFTIRILGSNDQHTVTIPNALEKFLGNVSNVQAKAAEGKRKKENEEKLQKKKLREKLRYLKRLLAEGKLILFKVKKRKKFDEGRYLAVLSLAKESRKTLGKNITYNLNTDKFYINNDKYLNIVNKDHDDLLSIKNLFFVYSSADIKSGFYTINSLSELDSAYCIIQEDTILNDIIVL